MKHITQTRTHVKRGFSLIELLVALSIFVTISAVVLANHTQFNSSVLLHALAYDIALSIREAQVFGLSVRQFNTDFNIGYGVHFSGSESYIFFADQDKNGGYNDNQERIQNYILRQGHMIFQFCGVTAQNVRHCSRDTQNPLTHLDIVFIRPEPDAIISSNRDTGYSFGIIEITSPGGEMRTVEVASTGQISVKQSE
jgi:prepilin-type N-terminal cleavage/methylation domain-containing protein